MTQSPLGQGPSGSDPFDERGAGNPDVVPTTGEATTDYPGTPYPDTPVSTSTETGYVGTSTGATDTGESSGSGGKVGEAKDQAKEVAGTATGQAKEVAGTAKEQAKNVAGTAKDEAKNVADTAVSAGKNVAATAAGEAKNVVAETKQQAASLLDTVRTEVGQQATTQQGRIADAVHSLAKELGSMASSSPESGPLTDLAQQASHRVGEVAHWLQEKEPADVLEAVRSYARRRPGTFLVLCGLAGVVAGRLTRSAVASRTSLDSGHSGSDRGQLSGNYSNHVVSEPGIGYTTQPTSGYAPTETTGGYGTSGYAAGATEPAVEPSTAMSTGVYGGSVESTGPAATGPAFVDPTPDESGLPGSGYVGTTRSLDDPNGDLNR